MQNYSKRKIWMYQLMGVAQKKKKKVGKAEKNVNCTCLIKARY
jgi:hypothetical protein